HSFRHSPGCTAAPDAPIRLNRCAGLNCHQKRQFFPPAESASKLPLLFSFYCTTLSIFSTDPFSSFPDNLSDNTKKRSPFLSKEERFCLFDYSTETIEIFSTGTSVCSRTMSRICTTSPSCSSGDLT